jgi:hypothetical protein
MSQVYERPSSGHTPEQIRTLRAKFHRKQKWRRRFESLGTVKGIYTVFMTGVAVGLFIALIIRAFV